MHKLSFAFVAGGDQIVILVRRDEIDMLNIYTWCVLFFIWVLRIRYIERLADSAGV
jgi:hypothetical protein